jgi:hypothetical protein
VPDNCCAAPVATTATLAATAATPDATRATRFSVPLAPVAAFLVADLTREDAFCTALLVLRPRFFFAAGRLLVDADLRLAALDLLVLLLFLDFLRAAIMRSPQIRGTVEPALRHGPTDIRNPHAR